MACWKRLGAKNTAESSCNGIICLQKATSGIVLSITRALRLKELCVIGEKMQNSASVGVPAGATQWFSGYTIYFSVFLASRMLGESGVVLFFLEASLVQEAILVQRHGMWKLLVVCSFLGCSFPLVEISSKANEILAPMRDGYWVSYLGFFFFF